MVREKVSCLSASRPLVEALKPLHKHTQNEQLLRDFLELALDNLRCGTSNPKACSTASKKLGESVETITSGIDSLTYILSECGRMSVAQEELMIEFENLGFEAAAQRILDEFISSHLPELRSLAVRSSIKIPEFVDLEWRLDVQVASRTAHKDIQASYLVNFVVKNPKDEHVNHYMEADATTMRGMLADLEQALLESRSARTRRVQRWVS